MKSCPDCATGHLYRIRRSSPADFLLSYAGLLPYRCARCGRRTLVADRFWLAFLCAGMLATAGATAFVVRIREVFARRPAPASSISVTAPEPAAALGNEEIAAMARADISPEVMRKLIAGQQHRFQIDSQSLIALKNDGVADEVILAIVEATLDRPTPAPPTLRPTARPPNGVDLARLNPFRH